MNEKQKLALKKELYLKAVEIIESRVQNTLAAMQSAQQASTEEEKSSAGDKYETSRAMNHLEKDMYAKQTEENNKELQLLHSIKYDTIYEVAVAGSLVDCSDCSFFIAAGLGKINFEGRIVYFLSANAPLAKLFFNKMKGEQIEFNKNKLTIESIC